MKKILVFFVIFIFFGCIQYIHASGCMPDSYYRDILQKRNWKLIQIQDNDIITNFNRTNMSIKGNRKYFTINFCEQYFSGITINSEFKTPYTITGNSRGDFNITEIDKNILSIDNEYNGITEEKYYDYLNNANKWWLYRDSLFKKWKLYLIIENENNKIALTFSY